MIEKKEPRWDDFLYTREWNIFINVFKVIGVIAVVILTYNVITEIESVKLLNSDVCQLCMEKTGATCFIGIGEVARASYRFQNATEIRSLFEGLVLNES